jgi:hypothetical protein
MEHLARLADLAEEDRRQFYASQPDFVGHHLATVLAQGAGLHWIDGTTGVKDLDVWSFFSLPPGYTRFPADIRKRHVDFGPSTLGRQEYDLSAAKDDRERRKFEQWAGFAGRRVDLMLRGLRVPLDADPATAIRAWLRRGKRQAAGSPWYLAQKGVVFIDPANRRGNVIWPA